MPVLLARRKPDHVAGPDFFDGSAGPLGPAAARRDDESLAKWMGVPRGPSAGFERHAGPLNQGRIGRLKQGIDPHRAGEPIRGSLGGRLRAASFDFHLLVVSFVPAFGLIDYF